MTARIDAVTAAVVDWTATRTRNEISAVPRPVPRPPRRYEI